MQSQYAQPENLVKLSVSQGTYNDWLNEPNALAIINAELQKASSDADSFLASQFDLPLQSDGYDMALTGAVCDIAAKRLYNRFGYNFNAPIDALIENRYKEAIDWLTKISREELKPQYTDSSGSPSSQNAGPFVLSNPGVGFGGQV